MVRQGRTHLLRVSYVAPEPTPREKPSPCRRGCCWTPFGHSVAATNCRCHVRSDDA